MNARITPMLLGLSLLTTACGEEFSNTTFDEDRHKVEAHLIGADEDFYGAEVQLEFLARLRDLKKFASAEELVGQIKRDIASTVKIAEQGFFCE